MITCFIDFDFLDILDILLVAVIIYQIYNLIKGTVAIKIFLGILLIYVIWKLVAALQMEMLGEILGQFIGVGVIALLIVFQQELRQFLVFVGNRDIFRGQKKTGLLSRFLPNSAPANQPYDEVIQACENMARTKTGALIILAQSSDPENFMTSMFPLDAKLSRDILESIFFKNSPLHDGAVVIKNGRISSARGILPVSEDTSISSELGMRHRAALGISEVTDTFALVVSEQNGLISCAHEGKLHRDLNAEKLAQLLNPGDEPGDE